MRSLFVGLFVIFSITSIKPVVAASSVTTLQEADCPFEFPANLDVTCGELSVPENRILPEGNHITLPFAMIHSPNPNPDRDPIIYTSSGGPGLGAFGAWQHLANNFEFLATRDIILLEQRGTRWSEPYLNCPNLNIIMFENLTRVEPREEEIAYEVQAALACHDELVEKGIDLNSYNTFNSVADLEDLRVMLGIKQWNFVGSSYAARIGLTYARLHPENLRSMVLDSVYDPSLNFIEARVPSFAVVLEQLFQACDENADCSQAYPNLEDHFHEVLLRANENLITVNIDHPLTGDPVTLKLTGDDLALGVFNTLRDARLLAYLPYVIEEIHAKNMSVITPLAQNGYTSLFNTPLGIYYAIECAEEYPFNDMVSQQIIAHGYPGLENFLPTPSDPYICEAWNAISVDTSFRDLVISDIPMLILSGEYDPVTPAAISKQTATRLQNAVYINVPGLSHAVMDVDTCTRQMASTFIESPASFSPTLCQPGVGKMEFVTRKDVLNTPIVYWVATKIHPAAVIAIPVSVAILAFMGLVISLKKRTTVLFISFISFLFIFFAGVLILILNTDPILLGFGIPSKINWALVGALLVLIVSTISIHLKDLNSNKSLSSNN